MIRIFCLLFIVLLMPTSGAFAKTHKPAAQSIPNVKPLIVTYDIYVGGVHFLTADILFLQQKKKYHSVVKARTYGFWHDILPWETTLDAAGDIADDRLLPSQFHTRDVFKNKPKTTSLKFDKKGDITAEFDPPSHDSNREVVTPEQKRGSLDPVSALVQMLASSAIDRQCNMTVPVFDGKRRFDITSVDRGMDAIDDDDYSVYKGSAHLCDATFTMVAGAWKEGEKSGFWKLNEKEQGREPFHIWLATLSPELPEMPVRLESGSVWGLIVMHLARWRYAAPDDLK